MKRPWVTYTAVGSVLLLLTLFLGLQYNWLVQASSAERDRLHRRVEEDTRRFAEEFNRAIQAAYFNFQATPEPLEQGNATEIAERYDYWRQNTEFPDLIKEIDYLKNSPENLLVRFDPQSRSFGSIVPDQLLESVVTRIRTEKRPPLLLANDSVMIVPIRRSEKDVETVILRRNPASGEKPVLDLPEPVGFVIITLDDAVVKGRLLLSLAGKYFQPSEYNISITNRESETVFNIGQVSQTPDIRASLYDMTPDNLIFFSNRNMVPRKAIGHDASIVFDQRVESHTVTATTDGGPQERGETFKIEMKEGDSPRRTAVIAGMSMGERPWTVNVQHTAGSIDAYINGERTKSFLIGLGVYFLLVGAILAIVISAMRSRAFAQRQIDFVSSVSHEFRTPLAVIYSAGENLADGIAKDETQVTRYGDLIKGEGRKLSGMVEQILEFAGARSGRKKYSFSATDISGIVREAVAEYRPEAVDAEIVTDIAGALPLVNADAESFGTAVRNLIQNAIKYSNSSPWVRVAVENGHGTVKISVEDRGIGIDPAEQKPIFRPFYRAKEVVDAQIHGSGLGLSMVKEIVEAHGGTVNVQSLKGRGSKFVIELPQAK